MDEYRVVWKREGRRQSTAIYQSLASAHRKACGILGLEATKDDTTLETLPDLERAPVIQSRSVGAWEPSPYQVDEAPEHAKKSMAELYAKDPNKEPSGVGLPF